MIFLVILFTIILVYVSEIGAYVWHRWGAHDNYIPKNLGVQDMHDKHHVIIDDQAHGDFLYILFFLFLLGCIILYLLYLEIISIFLALFYLPIFFTFLWNWYIHSAYHIENHWLNSYQWFRNDKRIHLQHHVNPNTNYGIATHFTDILFDTFNYGFPLNS